MKREEKFFSFLLDRYYHHSDCKCRAKNQGLPERADNPWDFLWRRKFICLDRGNA